MSRKKTAAALVGLGVAGILAAGLILPSVIEARLAGWIDSAVESAVDLDVSIGSVDVSVISSFPRVRVAVDDLVLTGREPFAGVELARLPRVELGVDLMSAIGGSQLVVERVASRGGTIHLVSDADGRANWSLVPEAESSGAESDPYRLRLDQVDLQDLAVVYEDLASDLRTDISDIDVSAQAELTQKIARVQSVGAIAALTVRYSGVTWLEATKWSSDMAVDYDQESGRITFGENKLTVNALPLAFSGSVAPVGEEDWDLDLAYRATDTTFGALLSLVPTAYGDQFAGVDAGGAISLEGTARGLYAGDSDDLPGFTLDVGITDGRFRFPDASTSVDGLSAKLHIDHPQGPTDTTRVRADHFALTAAGSTAKGRFTLATPISDPDIDLMVDGRVDLGAIGRALPADAGAPPTEGVLDLDFAVKGKMSDFEQEKLGLVKADGTIRGQGIKTEYDGERVEIDRLDLVLDPRTFKLNALALRMLGSDVALSGTLDDVLPWLLTDDGVLRGELALRSNRLDLRPFQAESEGAAAAAEDDQVIVAVPSNLDVGVAMDVKTFQTDDFTMTDVKGRVGVADGAVRMDGLRGSMLGGQVRLDGTYAAPTDEQADLDMTVRVERLIVGDVLATFETMKRIAPVLERADGTFDADFAMQARLGRDGTPDLGLLSSIGAMIPVDMSLRSETTQAVLGQLGGKAESLVLAGVKVGYALEGGSVDLKPFTAKLGKQDATIHGRFGPLDRSLDLKIDLPVDAAALKGSALLGSLGGAVPKTVDVRATIGGTYDKPKVMVGLKGDQAAEIVDAALDPLVTAAMEAGDKLIAEARIAADKLIAEAGKAADKLVAAAREEGKKLKKDAKGNPLKEVAAKAAADTLEKEADKAAKKARREAEKAADKLIDDATKKRDSLVEEARAKVADKVGGG